MNPLLTTKMENFRAGEDDLHFFFQKGIIKQPNGVLLFNHSGEADVTINMEPYHISPCTSIIIAPHSVFSLTDLTEDFKVSYFAFSNEILKEACYRLDSSFLIFLKKKKCYTQTDPQLIKITQMAFKICWILYNDKGNLLRDKIAKSLLQVIMLSIYSKVQQNQLEKSKKNSSRQEHLFKQFVSFVYTFCKTQRDVMFYAERLCISTRYLSVITKQIGRYSAKSIIDEIAVLEIKTTLQSTDLSVKEIAEMYNYPDQSSFARYFKKHTGLSPQQYRARL